MSQRMRKLWEEAQKKAQQSLDLDSEETWMLSHFEPRRIKCNKPATPLSHKQVPVGCIKVLPPSNNGSGANRQKASRATRKNFGQGGNGTYNIRKMAKREAETKKREAAMKEITQVLKELTRRIDTKHRHSCSC